MPDRSKIADNYNILDIYINRSTVLIIYNHIFLCKEQWKIRLFFTKSRIKLRKITTMYLLFI